MRHRVRGTMCECKCEKVSRDSVTLYTDSYCKRTSSSSRVDEMRAESWNNEFWIQCVMVGVVVPVLADNPLAYNCLCPVSLHIIHPRVQTVI